MSYMKINRKRTMSPKMKLHSQQSRANQSKNNYNFQKQSVQRIMHQNINSRRFSTHNSLNKTIKSEESVNLGMKNEIEQAKKAFKQKNTKKALTLFKQLYKKHPKSAQIPYYIGSCLLNESKYDSSITYFKLSLAIDPNYEKNVYLYLAVNFKAMGNCQSACSILNEAIQKFPRFQEAFFYRAKMLMKIGNNGQAIQDLKKCLIMNSSNELAYMFLGDNLRILHKFKQAVEKYDKGISLQGSHMKMIYLKKVDLLMQIKRWNQLKIVIEEMKHKNFESPILNLYEGFLSYEQQKYTQATISIEIGLTGSLNKNQIIKAFKVLFNICIQKKDFFEAEHLIKRAKNNDICCKQLQYYYDFVEGVNDIIKRKLPQAFEKLSKTKENISKLNKQEYAYFMKLVLPYYAYCQFLQNANGQALESYNIYLKMEPSSQSEQYNRNICEGVILNKRKEFEKAQKKFSQASLLVNNRIEPIFFNCINAVQKLKFISEEMEQFMVSNKRQQTIRYLKQSFESSSNINPINSLFLFYQSLVMLFDGEDPLSIIKKAIKIADEDISQYYYIKGLCHSLRGQTHSGLQCINKAIQLDHNIGQFFKERSKYFYVLERYDEACQQIERILQDNDDDEGKLLLTFYYYMNDQFKESYELLKTIKQSSSDGKFKEFEEALNFRIGNYDKCGVIGHILKGIIFKNCELAQEDLTQIKKIISKREIQSQFTTYHAHLLLAIYFCYNENFQSSLEHLFGSLQQIQYFVDQKEEFSPMTESMLNQIKFNIIVVSLIKQTDPQKPQTLKYIQVFIAETQNQQFLAIMQTITEAVEKDKIIHEITTLYDDIIKVSDYFPEITLKIGKSVLKTKLLALYPQKLKFNIAPQFDDSFLYNFDIDKIDNKLSPPWYKVQNHEILFTDKIRNESIMLSQTEKPSTPLLVPTPIPVNLKDKFKLDDVVEKKLQKLMHK